MEIIYNEIYNNKDKRFKPEVDEGNIEYKWRLDKKDVIGLKKLTSQMLWRLNEGYDITNNYEVYRNRAIAHAESLSWYNRSVELAEVFKEHSK